MATQLKIALRRLNNIPASGKGMNDKARQIKFNTGALQMGAEGRQGGRDNAMRGGGVGGMQWGKLRSVKIKKERGKERMRPIMGRRD